MSIEPVESSTSEPDRRPPSVVDQSAALVREWLGVARTVKVDSSARQLAHLLQDPRGLGFTVSFIDGVIRPEDPAVAASKLADLAANIPPFVPAHLRLAMKAGAATSRTSPSAVISAVRHSLRRMVSHLIIDARDENLRHHIERLRGQGFGLNLNVLGEAVLGDSEAERRLDATHRLLERDDVDYVSVKVSSVVAPHSPWAFEESVEKIVAALKPLFHRAAAQRPAKFINLDMEEYRDLDLTVEVFTRLLDIEGFDELSAGIALQAYLPDSLAAMQRLQQWASARVARGGAPIKVRVVKGANLPMERVEADQRGWPLVTWGSKQETDSSYLSLLDYALRPEHTANVRIGVAGHNLFHLAWAWITAEQRGVCDAIDVEMLLGMSPAHAEAVRRTVTDVLLYTPVVNPSEFDAAIAYLVRRLDEGASSENFLSAAFDLDRDEALFDREKARFDAAIDGMFSEPPSPRRSQDRRNESPTLPNRFANTPDTDPSLAANREWARGIWAGSLTCRSGIDLTANTLITAPDMLDLEFSTALEASTHWGQLSGTQRAELLRKVAHKLAERRRDLVEVMVAECGKTISEADPEVSEAIDFAQWYADVAERLDDIDGASIEPVRLTAVVPPWNFPVAIPAGSVLAALAAGSAVLLKPAPQARRCSAVLAQAMWDAGVPTELLRLVNVDEDEVGRAFVSDPRIDRMIFTGSCDTAALFKSWRPELEIIGETSGKNAIVVMPSADLDLAVKDIVTSAFGHAGQKCSAASLVILVGKVAHSERFRRQLIDAVRSLPVGFAHDPNAIMGPVIEPPSGKLLEGLTQLQSDETWLVQPERRSERLWTPGVRDNVQPGSDFHQREYFGPVLGIMSAASLDSAIAIQNGTDYGLTAGLHALNTSEISYWMDRVEAGNLYINRPITGAMVRRQPFGGWKNSSIGPGAKTGGPNYLVGLAHWRKRTSRTAVVPPAALLDFIDRLCAVFALAESERLAVQRAAFSDAGAWNEVFSQTSDTSRLWSERNVLRYRQAGTTIRLSSTGMLADFVRVVAAAKVVGPIVVSVPNFPVAEAIVGEELTVEVATDAEWLASVANGPAQRIRLIGMDAATVHRAAGGRPDIVIFDEAVTESGYLELLPFLREQAISVTAHRFGTAWSAS